MEHEHTLVIRLFDAGLPLLHLRKPGYDHEAMSGYIARMPESLHQRIVIHSCYELARDFNLRGVHITGADMPDKLAIIHQFKSKKGFTISISSHSLELLKVHDPDIDYIFLSPVFDSISKKNYKAQFNIIELTEALKRSKTDVIALGGIQVENIHKVKGMGFKGMAFFGAVWESADPVKSYKAIQDKLLSMQQALTGNYRIEK